MKLYEITDNMRELQAMADTGELLEGDIMDTMNGLDCEFNLKAEAVLKVRQSMIGEIANIDREVARLIELKKAPENSAQRLVDYVKSSMLVLGKDKLDLGVFRVTMKKATVKLGSVDESKISPEFWKVVPETKKLDRRMLLSSAKESAIDGVELVDSERALLIK